MGDLSAHFSRHEFDCPHCGKLVIDANLIRRLEALRGIVGKPLPITSGYRCLVYNRAVGGVRYSQHLHGRAADIPRGYCTVRQALDAGFTGIGHRADRVVHVDVRPPPRAIFLD
jgi:zinc D-Ala-D-Ala carboxypeptidase